MALLAFVQSRPWSRTSSLVPVLVLVVLALTTGWCRGQGGCSAAARDFYAMTFCAECEIVNGVPVASSRPTRRINQTCVSPCIQPIPRPCIYMERPWTTGAVDVTTTGRANGTYQSNFFLRAKCAYTRTQAECGVLGSGGGAWSPFETTCPDYGGTVIASSGQTFWPFGPNNKTLVPGAIPHCPTGYYGFVALSVSSLVAHPFCYLPSFTTQIPPVLAPLGNTEYQFYVMLNSTGSTTQFARIDFDTDATIPSPTVSGVGVVCRGTDPSQNWAVNCSPAPPGPYLHQWGGYFVPSWNDAPDGPVFAPLAAHLIYPDSSTTFASLGAPADELRMFFPASSTLRVHQPSYWGPRTAYGLAQEAGRVLGQPLATGLCGGGTCVASVTPTNGLATSNPTNDPCAGSSCVSRLTNAALALVPPFDPATPSYWTTPACTPISTGYPRCTSLDAGYPSLAYASSFLVFGNQSGALARGDPCNPASSCVSEAFCFEGRCTPSKTGTASCELFTCRECSPYGGTCTGPPVLTGNKCYRGCLNLDQGTCTASQSCVGDPITGIGCAASQGIFLPNATVNGDCYVANCVVLPSFMETNRTTYAAPQYGTSGIPVTFEDAALILEDILLGTGGLTECTLSYAAGGDPCNDLNACTNETECSGFGTCETLKTYDPWCLATACVYCNPTSGTCTGPVAPDFFSCVSACAEGPAYQGYCQSGVCDASFRDPAVCVDFSSLGHCNTSSCRTQITGARVPQEPGFTFSQDALVAAAGALPLCNTTNLAAGDPCFAAALGGDRCVVQETCTASGACGNIVRFNCSDVIAQTSECGNVTTAKCNAGTGACEALPVANGTACNDGNLCTTGDTCFAFPAFPDIGVCVPGPSIPCSTGGNPCVESATCDPDTGLCILTPAVNGIICSLGVPFTGVCPQNGTCLGGLCVPPSGTCPPLNAVCAAAGCNTTTGNCTIINRPDGLGCNDGNKCTEFDTCTAGSCAGITISCLPLPTDCFILGSPVCVPTPSAGSGCNYAPLPSGTTCLGGRGRCDSVGTCVCQRACIQGTCVYEALNGTSCACFTDYTGANCEIYDPLITSTAISDFYEDTKKTITDFFNDNTRYLIWAALAVFGLASSLVGLCRPSVRTIDVEYTASTSDAALERVVRGRSSARYTDAANARQDDVGDDDR